MLTSNFAVGFRPSWRDCARRLSNGQCFEAVLTRQRLMARLTTLRESACSIANSWQQSRIGKLGAKFKVLATIWMLLLNSPVYAEKPPIAKGNPVIDHYHGIKVVDEFRWLENWNDPAVRKWSEEQNAYARSVLDHLPHVDAIRARVTEIMSAKNVEYFSLAYRPDGLFAMKREPPKQQPFLVILKSADDLDSERIVIDPNVLDSKGSTSIDWFVPSHNSELVAVSLSTGGSESGDVHIYETSTGREVFEVIPRVNGGTAGGDLAWLPDDSGFFYTRYPRGDERPAKDMDFYQQVYLHQLGKSTEEDRFEIGNGLPRIAEIELQMNSKSGHLLATVQNGDGGEFAHFLRSPDTAWHQFSQFDDGIIQVAFGTNDDLFMVSREDAPKGKVLRMPISNLDVSKAAAIIPQGEDTIVTSFWGKPTVLPTRTRLYVTYQLGGPSEIRVFDHNGNPQTGPQQAPVSAVSGLTRLADDNVLFRTESFVEPGAYYRFQAKDGKTEKTAIAMHAPVDFSDVKVVREFATSKDGTKVPLNILMPAKALLDGPNPCLVTGYGGYGISVAPGFRSTTRVLLDQGIIFVVANLRGGGEYGDTWHRQGNLTNKQNVFDDFASVLRHLIEQGYTSSDKLAITGGSNGGLLMGATLTQHPELVKCVISHVGIYDMLRVENAPNGAFNITEFGTVKDRAQFDALYAYSPYHHVEDGVKYPATLFLTGANDPRVDPMHSRKMTARLQAAQGKEANVLLRTSMNSGHGGDTALDERIEQTVDVYALLLDQLGLKFRR